MHLSYLKAFLSIVALTTACHESTAPPRTVSGVYLLESVNGQPVPAVVYAGPADTTFMRSATLTLDVAGNAVRSEHWRYVYQPNRTDEGTFIANVHYKIAGDNITVGSFGICPPDALCEGNKVGKLTSTALTLSYDSPTAPVFLYRLEPTL